MQYLAQVEKSAVLGGLALGLLARHAAGDRWEVLPNRQTVQASDAPVFQVGHLVLVEIDPQQQVQTVDDALPWLLEVVRDYLQFGLTPAALEQEIERAEQWRQSLTLKSQEVDRRALETAARRDEIQELERNIKQEQEELARRWDALNQQEDSQAADNQQDDS